MTSETPFAKMKWPKKDLLLADRVVETWGKQVEVLLELQEPDFGEYGSAKEDALGSGTPPVLLPLEVMVQPLALRFRYHFYGNKPTNRLDKPEYFLSHALDLLDQHNIFLSDYLQPILDDRIRASEVAESTYTDSISAFITALLPLLKEKCLSLLPQLVHEPQLLSHFVHELMSFDTTLRETWLYRPAPHHSRTGEALRGPCLLSMGISMPG